MSLRTRMSALLWSGVGALLLITAAAVLAIVDRNWVLAGLLHE